MGTPVSDENLMELYQKGDAEAFRELFHRHRKSVYNYIYRYTGSLEETEEIFQEVFVKLHRAMPSYQPTAKFVTWLFTIIRNLCIDQHRKKRLRNNVSFDDPSNEGEIPLSETIPSDEPTPDNKSFDQEIHLLLERALKGLCDEQREVFLMREKMGLKFEEIAEMAGVSINTVKSRMRYALENLRKFLEKSGYQDLNPSLYR